MFSTVAGFEPMAVEDTLKPEPYLEYTLNFEFQVSRGRVFNLLNQKLFEALHRAVAALPRGRTTLDTRENPFTRVVHYRVKSMNRRREVRVCYYFYCYQWAHTRLVSSMREC